MTNRFLIKLLSIIFFITANPISLLAQTQGPDISTEYYNIMVVIFVVMLVLIIVAFLYWGTEEGKAEEKKETLKVWGKIKEYLVAAKPIEEEHEILMDHDYDGIKELDNKIPPWFSILFYTTIVIAVIYFLNYQVFKTGMSQAEEYKAEMKQAALVQAELEKSGKFLNENNVTLLTAKDQLQNGAKIFKTNCVACHRDDAGGAVGPNLTDNYWIHGGGIKNIFTTIKYGVPSKGMVTWQNTLSPKEIQQVASYVISLKGSNPVNPKPPQGELYVPADTSNAAESIKEKGKK